MGSGLSSPKLELEAERSGEDETVWDVGGDGLVRSCSQVGNRIVQAVRFELEVDRAVVDPEPTPPPLWGAVGAQQAGGQGVLVPGSGLSEDGQILGKLGAIAERAFDGRTDVSGATVCVEHPCSILERRLVADVLAVVAGKVRYPISVAVDGEVDDGSDHGPTVADIVTQTDVARHDSCRCGCWCSPSRAA